MVLIACYCYIMGPGSNQQLHVLQLCKIIEGQRYTKALSRMQRQKQIEIGKQSPQDRRHVCEDVILIHLLDCVATPT